jgi:hypothetical protein
LNIRTAILKAADHIERHPGDFSFKEHRYPAGAACGTPGCALGWIGFFAGLHQHGWDVTRTNEFLGIPYDLHVGNPFYERMDDLCGTTNWRFNVATCALGLRRYADKYFPAESPAVPVAFPDWMAIARGDVKCVEAP